MLWIPEKWKMANDSVYFKKLHVSKVWSELHFHQFNMLHEIL